MPTPSKFTEERRGEIYNALDRGASLTAAAGAAGIDEATVRTWIAQGEKAKDGAFREFRDMVMAIRAGVRVMAAKTIYSAAETSPKWAAWLLEHTDPEFAPASQRRGTSDQPVVIKLTLGNEGLVPPTPLPSSSVEVIDSTA